jgi:hypothetical protein
MRTIFASFCFALVSVLAGANLQAQAYRLKPEMAISIPAEEPYGVTYHGEHFWITDPGTGDILRLHRWDEDLFKIRAPRKQVTGITFEGDDLWVLVDAWDTITYPHHDLPKTQAYKLDPADGVVLDSIMIPYYNVPEVSQPYMMGMAWFDSSYLVSCAGGWGPSMVRIGWDRRFSGICCAHPAGMEVIGDELWAVRQEEADGTGQMILPVEVTDSLGEEDMSRRMEFDFSATDLAHDGSNVWLLDPQEKKLKMMVIADTLPADPTDTIHGLFSIDLLEVIPASPTIEDEVSIVSHTTFSSGGCGLAESQVVHDSNSHFIFAAHNMGMLTYICHSVDTFNLGRLSRGYHEVTYELSILNMEVHSLSETIKLFVGDTIPPPYYIELIPEDPVAGQEVKIVTHGICYVNTWFDLIDRHINLRAYYNSCSMAPCGLDTLSLGFLSADSYTLDYYLYDICADPSWDSLVYYEQFKFDVTGATGLDDISAEDILVYPNPAGDVIYITIPGDDRAFELALYAVTGQLLRQERLLPPVDQRSVSLDGLPAGILILRLSNGINSYAKRLVIRK